MCRRGQNIGTKDYLWETDLITEKIRKKWLSEHNDQICSIFLSPLIQAAHFKSMITQYLELVKAQFQIILNALQL
jgi:hypothetical protein